ncbi:copper chaperone PCu(A)C [Oleiagrimonas sp. C23AA]|uniref:copper chaperone PCu(A)C n=1 Tax=Oleiagrimonas sp. C23AA TaxID=2719047 RepID=UPI00141E6826|nr:copper chaperone PCu(A)C [Oleiagrimonas sp. C23AA]NII11680.1 copper chaperone PCu(A)C [Oleiagrimonas sp. C23AA]
MKTLLSLVLASTLAVTASAVAAAPQAHSNVSVSHAWIRVLPGALPGGGYATVHNHGEQAVQLVGADSPAYGHIMLHKSTTEGGVSRMAAVKAITVPAHGQVAFAPGGYHLMMMQAKTPVKPGQSVPVTLHFASGATLKVPFKARPANAIDDTH